LMRRLVEVSSHLPVLFRQPRRTRKKPRKQYMYGFVSMKFFKAGVSFGKSQL
jgi:hypothetical protein